MKDNESGSVIKRVKVQYNGRFAGKRFAVDMIMWRKVIVIALVGCVIFVSSVWAQRSLSPLELRIDINGKPCVGEDFEIVSRLTNVSTKKIRIDRRFLMRYRGYIAEDSLQNQSPRMFEASSDGFFEKRVREEYVIELGPGGHFEVITVIQPEKDFFFNHIAKYTITTGYGQFVRKSQKGHRLYVGKVTSNNLAFQIRDCG